MSMPPIFRQAISVAVTAVVFTVATQGTKRVLDYLGDKLLKPSPVDTKPTTPAEEPLL